MRWFKKKIPIPETTHLPAATTEAATTFEVVIRCWNCLGVGKGQIPVGSELVGLKTNCSRCHLEGIITRYTGNAGITSLSYSPLFLAENYWETIKEQPNEAV